jgi:hypothetical protein
MLLNQQALELVIYPSISDTGRPFQEHMTGRHMVHIVESYGTNKDMPF